MAQDALGMVETRGLTAAIDAADAMTKTEVINEKILITYFTLSLSRFPLFRHGSRRGASLNGA